LTLITIVYDVSTPMGRLWSGRATCNRQAVIGSRVQPPLSWGHTTD